MDHDQPSQALVAPAVGAGDDYPLQGTVDGAFYTDLHRLVYSIALHYHNQKTWAFQTRSALELALARGDVVPRLVAPASPDSPSPASFSSAPASLGSINAPASVSNDAFTFALAIPPRTNISAARRSPASALAARRNKWSSRKNRGLHLRLDGLSNFAHRQEVGACDSAVVVRRPTFRGPTPSASLLQLYSDLVDERMESCQRVTRLIQASNRANLVNRFQG